MLTKALIATMGLAAAPCASAATVVYHSDAEFASVGFQKYFGANVRWGGQPPEANRTWEYAIVTDPPVTTSFIPYDQKEFVYPGGGSSTTANHQYRLSYATDSYTSPWGSSSAGDASLDIFSPSATSNDDSLKNVSSFVDTGTVNALAIRAKAVSGYTSVLFDAITVSFHSDDSLTLDADTGDLAALMGDDNAEYLLLLDPRLGGGFTVAGTAALVAVAGYAGDQAAYQFKVGHVDSLPPSGGTVVPLPPAVWLLSLGLMGYLGIGATRQQGAVPAPRGG